jgi:hypothetical protein
MPSTTPNFGFEYPLSTDNLSDGAQSIQDFATTADTTFIDLKGGTSNQLLAKNSNTDMDYKWVEGINGGTTGQVLTKDTNTDYDYSWATPAVSGGFTLLGTVSMDNGTYVSVGSIPNTYTNLFMTVEDTNPAKGSNTATGSLGIRFNNDTTTYWAMRNVINGTTAITNAGTNNDTSIASPAIFSGTLAANSRVWFSGWVYNYNSTRPSVSGHFISGANVFVNINGAYDAAVTEAGFRTSGTFDGGTLKVWGVK